MGHVKMMGAVQPFISGAISKTVNLPEEATVEDVSQLLIESWQLGVKAIAIYRDNCKVAQPLSGSADKSLATIPALARRSCRVAQPKRRRVPEDRVEVGRKFKVGDYEGYIHVGLFEDGTPGDIFVDIAKEGTTLAGLMNSFMISVSLGLQYGVPLEVYVSKFSHMRFEPSGLTNDADIRIAKSIVDYIFRWMGKKFLTSEQQEEAGILTAEVKARLAQAYATGEASELRPPRRRRGARPRSSTPGRTRSSAPSAAAAWCARELLHVPRLRHEHRLQLAQQLAVASDDSGRVRRHRPSRRISSREHESGSADVLYGPLMLVRILIIGTVALFLVLWVRAVLDVFRRGDLTGAAKPAWAIIMLVFPFVGLLVYVMLRPSDAQIAQRSQR